MADERAYGSGAVVPVASTNSSALSVDDAISRTFNNIQTNITDPYNAGYNAALNSYNMSSDQIVEKIMNNLNLSDPSSYLSAAKDLADLNTASSEAMAREMMAFQERANAKAMDFSASEALKTREWQTLMSNTAHQREVADLIKAGLNPVLSANNGAPIGSAANAQGVTSAGAMGQVDMSAVNALVGMYQKAADMAMQEKNLAMEQKQLDANVLMNALNNETNRYSADRAANATMYSANASSSAHRYAAELDYDTWASGLHNQWAQLGEWIFKALTGLNFNFNNAFNLGGSIGEKLGDIFKGDYDGTGMRTGYKGYETPNDFFQGNGRTFMHMKEMEK